jgi:hypothetical protein
LFFGFTAITFFLSPSKYENKGNYTPGELMEAKTIPVGCVRRDGLSRSNLFPGAILAQPLQHRLEHIHRPLVLIQGKMFIRRMIQRGISRAVSQGRAAPGRGEYIQVGSAGL